MAKTSLSIYLLKDGIEQVDAFKQNFEVKEMTHYPVGDGDLYFINKLNRKPAWVSGFYENMKTLQDIRIASASTVFFKKILIDQKEHVFIVTNGYGYSLLDSDKVVQNFGLKVAMGVISSDKIKRTSVSALSGTKRMGEYNLPRVGTINDIGIDVYQDLVKGITGECNIPDFHIGKISGKDALSVTSEITISNIDKFLVKLYKIYDDKDYKNNFSWVDNVTHVKNTAMKQELDEKLINLINTKDENIWLGIPDVIDWINFKEFRVNRNNCFQDLTFENVFGDKKIISASQLRNKQINYIDGRNDEVTNGWSAYKCLFGEIQHNERAYCIRDGDWFEIKKDYVEKICNEYNQIPISKTAFPNYDSKFKVDDKYSEAKYNSEFAKYKDNLVLLDRCFINYGGGQNKVELCDILSFSKTLYHVKVGTASANLSHLFNQAAVTMQYLKSDLSFINDANKQIEKAVNASDGKEFRDFQINENDDFTIVYAIVTKARENRPRIPFFSKVALLNAQRLISAMKVKVEIANIQDLR